MAFAWQLKEELAGNDGDITGAARGRGEGGEGGGGQKEKSDFKVQT